jgi:phosphoglycerate kinase
MDKMVINQLPVEKLRGQRVFVRLDTATAPSSCGVLFDESRLRSSLPTVEYLMGVGARSIIGTHLGSLGGRVDRSLRLDPLAERLTALLGRPVRKLDEAIGRDVWRAVADLRDGEVLVLENLRFYAGEEANEAELARELAKLCDVYCNDAFTLAHRSLASTVGITRNVRPAAAGLALARELLMFAAVFDTPEPPFVGLVAGTRLEDKLPILEHLRPRLNRLCIGGALACTFLKAKGHAVGAAPVDAAFLPLAEEFLHRAEHVEIILPQDFIVVQADQFRAYEENGRKGAVPAWRHVLEHEMQPADLPVDIGPATIKRIIELFEVAQTIFWNGPLGLWEIEPFRVATCEVARGLAERVSLRNPRSLLCGESLWRAMRSCNLPVERLRHLTPGGESALQLLAGNPLPAVAALDNAVALVVPIETRPRRIVLPVDGSAHSRDVARRLGQLVDAVGAVILLLYVQKPDDVTTGPPWMESDVRRRRDFERQMEAERIFATINAALAQQGLTSHGQLMIDGDPADEVLKFADEIGADLIAMGSHGRTGLRRFLMGSVSRQVLDHAKCPVLIVRTPEQRLVEAGRLATSSA